MMALTWAQDVAVGQTRPVSAYSSTRVPAELTGTIEGRPLSPWTPVMPVADWPQIASGRSRPTHGSWNDCGDRRPATIVDHDLTAGGRVTYYMTGQDGEPLHGWWRIISVDPPRSLEFEDGCGPPNEELPTYSVGERLLAVIKPWAASGGGRAPHVQWR